MVRSRRMDLTVWCLIVVTSLLEISESTEAPSHEVDQIDLPNAPHPSPVFSCLHELLKGKIKHHHPSREIHPNATEGPDDFLRKSSVTSLDHLGHSRGADTPPLREMHPSVPNPQPIPIYINSGSSPVEVAKDSNGAFSIQVSTKIDFGGGAATLHVPQGSLLGPIVLNNNIQIHLPEVKDESKGKPKEFPTYEYSDDEDYYFDEGSGATDKVNTSATTTTADYLEDTDDVSKT